MRIKSCKSLYVCHTWVMAPVAFPPRILNERSVIFYHRTISHTPKAGTSFIEVPTNQSQHEVDLVFPVIAFDCNHCSDRSANEQAHQRFQASDSGPNGCCRGKTDSPTHFCAGRGWHFISPNTPPYAPCECTAHTQAIPNSWWSRRRPWY